jgi:hypothetical protein
MEGQTRTGLLVAPLYRDDWFPLNRTIDVPDNQDVLVWGRRIPDGMKALIAPLPSYEPGSILL